MKPSLSNLYTAAFATLLTACGLNVDESGSGGGLAVGPDLVIELPKLGQTHGDPNERISVEGVVVNIGSRTAAVTRLKYYFSRDATLDDSDIYRNYDSVGELGIGGQSAESANVRIPDDASDGNAFILLVADYDDDIEETNEDNNVAALPIVIGGGAPSNPGGPDLVVRDANLSSARAEANTVVAAGVRIVNEGEESAPETRLKYFLSTDAQHGQDRYLNYDQVSALDPGVGSSESANLRVPSGTADGRYYVLFVADELQGVVESDESNNVAALKLTVGDPPAAPDLALDDIVVSATSVAPDSVLPVSVVVRNEGEAVAAESYLKYFISEDDAWSSDDRHLSYDKVDALAPGESSSEGADLRIPSGTRAGQWFLLLVADADGSVAESYEDDNIVAIPFAVSLDDPTTHKPDLVATSATVSAAVVASGGSLALSATVANNGPAEATASSRLKYFWSRDAAYDPSDVYLNYDSVPALSPSESSMESATVSVPSGLDDGTWHVLFVVDETNAVAETYESNNVVATEVIIGYVESTDTVVDQLDADLPDLVTVEARVADRSVRAGERAALSLAIENAGAVRAEASRVKYYLSRNDRYDEGVDRYLTYDNVGALDPGDQSPESADVLIPADYSHGPWYIVIVVDAVGDVAETFESNNVSAVVIDVVVDDPSKDAANVVFQDVTASRTSLPANDHLVLETTLSNLGGQPSGENRLKYYLSTNSRHDAVDVYLGYHDVPPLDEGDAYELSASLRIPLMTEEGDYYLLLVADVNNDVDETYESDNLHAVAIEIDNQMAPMDPEFPYSCPSHINPDATLLAMDTIATFNVLHLGWANGKDLLALACVVSHFRLVGLVEVDDPDGVVDLIGYVEQLTHEDWSYHVSEHAVGDAYGTEYYGYLWRTAEVTMTSSLGFYADPYDWIKREPYGANFRMGSFDFTLVVFHLRYGSVLEDRRTEAVHLIDIYEYFQAQNGAEQDVLIGGDFNLPGNEPSFTVVGHDSVRYITDPEQPTSLGPSELRNSFDNIFYPGSYLSEYRGSGAYDFTRNNHSAVRETVSDHIPVWMSVDTSIDDD